MRFLDAGSPPSKKTGSQNAALKSRRQRNPEGAHGPFSDLFNVAASRPAK
jgi:hypothetical protein